MDVPEGFRRVFIGLGFKAASALCRKIRQRRCMASNSGGLPNTCRMITLDHHREDGE
jgi:hypothetical protein